MAIRYNVSPRTFRRRADSLGIPYEQLGVARYYDLKTVWQYWQRPLAPVKQVHRRLYLVHAVSTNLYKLGYSTRPKARLKELQTSSPYTLQTVALRAGTQAEERQLHIILAAHRLKGEWFEQSDFETLRTIFLDGRCNLLRSKT